MKTAAAPSRVPGGLRRLPGRIWRVLAPVQDDRVHWVKSAPFFTLHGAVLLVPVLGFGVREAVALAAVYCVGMFAITAGYHRLFSHRSYRTSRAFQFVLAFLAQATVQKGALWWASQHRHHHRWSDKEEDVHSPLKSFFWGHMGWVLSRRADAVRTDLVRDLSRLPEIRWLDRFHLVPALCVGAAFFAVGGLQLLVGGYVLGVVCLFHATATINSLAHLWGTRRYATDDQSRNNMLLALLTFGEGWHNNHHHRPSSVRQGVRWWEIDVSWYVLVALSRVGVVWDLRGGPRLRSRAPTVVPSYSTATASAGGVGGHPRAAVGSGDPV